MLKIYNTLTRKKEVFKARNGKKINLFVCGITPYDNPHIGHAKTYVQFDIIVKYLRFRGYNIFYLQNITDIDDRIIERSNKLNKNFKEISREFEKIYLSNMKDLRVNSIDKYARATNYIKEIEKQVKTLMKKGYAYKIDDGIYFDLSKSKDYGKLSGRTYVEAEDSVTRIDKSKKKKNKGDFCLWKFSKKNEPKWKISLGDGRPGWHIEDTAITEKFFGKQYDLHGGARDLIFPHHEAEIAQMEAISGKKPFVKYWMHTGFLNVKGSKMSKSFGNFITISELLKKYTAEEVRYFFISSHYRSPIDFNLDIIGQSRNALQSINDFVLRCKNGEDKVNSLINKARKDFINAMDNDFDTVRALAVIHDFMREVNKKEGGKKVYKFMMEIDEIFNIITLDDKINEEIKDLIKDREMARKKKDFKKADKLRSLIKKKGYLLEDTSKGVRWKKAR